jgi:hypothetical protein
VYLMCRRYCTYLVRWLLEVWLKCTRCLILDVFAILWCKTIVVQLCGIRLVGTDVRQHLRGASFLTVTGTWFTGVCVCWGRLGWCGGWKGGGVIWLGCGGRGVVPAGWCQIFCYIHLCFTFCAVLCINATDMQSIIFKLPV